jgi:hypothetical protein
MGFRCAVNGDRRLKAFAYNSLKTSLRNKLSVCVLLRLSTVDDVCPKGADVRQRPARARVPQAYVTTARRCFTDSGFVVEFEGENSGENGGFLRFSHLQFAIQFLLGWRKPLLDKGFRVHVLHSKTLKICFR